MVIKFFLSLYAAIWYSFWDTNSLIYVQKPPRQSTKTSKQKTFFMQNHSHTNQSSYQSVNSKKLQKNISFAKIMLEWKALNYIAQSNINLSTFFQVLL
jgi:hypothetical protein